LGRNSGVIPPGFEINGIPFSTTTASDGKLIVSINDPVGGMYDIAVYAYGNGSVRVSDNATSQGGFSQQENREFEIKQGWGYYIPFELDVDEQGSIVSVWMGEVRTLKPEVIAEKFHGIQYRPYLS
jgi:hypothetical protein